MKKIAALFHTKDDKSFFSTLLLSFLTTAIIASLLLTFFLTANYIHTLISNLTNYNQQLLSQTNYAINQMDEKVERLALYLMNSNEVSAFLSLKDQNSTAPVLAGKEVDKQLMVLPFVESVYLYNSSMDLVYSSVTGEQTSIDALEDKNLRSHLKDFKFLTENTGKPIVSSANSQTGSAEIVSFYFPDYHAVDKTDTIIINVHVSAVTDSLASIRKLTKEGNTETSFALFDAKENYMAGVWDSDFSVSSDTVFQEISSKYSEDNTSFLKIGNMHYFLVSTNNNTYGWNLLNIIPAKEIVQNLIITTVWSLLILICVFLVMFFICVRFANSLNGPVETLELILNGKQNTLTKRVSGPKEFQTILSSVAALQQNNQKLFTLQQKSKYSLTQSCLNSLVMNHNLDSPKLVEQKLEHLKLTYVTREKLCMAVFKIDNYNRFLESSNPDELWAIRFSAVNIIEELSFARFTCNAFSQENDKFVLLLSCESEYNLPDFETHILDIFHSVQENLSTYLKLTVSVAYSTVFQGIDNLPVVYKNMERLLLMKIHYGHNSIIAPFLDDESEEVSFQLSWRTISQLTDRIANGQLDASWDTYCSVTETLTNCNYNEIISTMIHIVHSIYERISEKYPMLRDFLIQDLKDFLSALEQAEIFEDIQELMRKFLGSICTSIQKLKENPNQQNASIIAEKVGNIILREYANPALCLCSIAEDIGLSANYTGQIFKQHTQKSISQYILEVRMEKLAQYLQTTSLPINKMLEKVGLEKNNYFYTRFKNYFGVSLNEYRQQLSGSADSNFEQ